MCAVVGTAVLLDILAVGDLAGTVKLRFALGPVGGLNPAGPRGGDRGLGE